MKGTLIITISRINLFLFSSILFSCEENIPSEPPAIMGIQPKAGVAGMRVFITGSNFSSENVITFNGLPGKVVKTKSNEIEVEVPEGGTTGPITITSSGETITGPEFRYYDIYLIGNEYNAQNKNVIKVWRNGKVESITDGKVTSAGLSLTVSGDDQYIAGYTFTGIKTIATYWKNKEEFPLAHEVIGLAQDIAINGTDVHVVGMEHNGTYWVGRYWKNSVGTDVTKGLADSETASSITIANGDVYIAGTVVNSDNLVTATYWKNGKEVPLEQGSDNSGVVSIEVIGSDVFVTGNKYPNPNNSNTSYAAYWKNGVSRTLTIGSLNAVADAIAFVGNTGYIVGVEYSSQGVAQAKLWNTTNISVSNVITGNNPSYAAGIVSIGDDIIIGGHTLINQKEVPYFKINDKVFQVTNMGSSVNITGIYVR